VSVTEDRNAWMQRHDTAGCLPWDMTTLELPVTEPRPFSATRSDADADAAYDLRFEAARDRLTRICAGFVGIDAAEDVVHDTYLRGRSRFAQLRDLDLFEAWLTRIAINVCMNRTRADRRLRDLLPFLRPRARAALRDVGLRELVERLPPRDRTLVVLRYGHGYQFEEIAQMTGLSAVNVRTIVFRARRRLADEIERADR
jgi:RNA polymerase sigma-70 factor (ECF subfamily)